MKRDTKNWTMETKNCLFCSNLFTIPVWRKAKTCSYKCSNNLPKSRMKGKKQTEYTKIKISDSHKGIIPINILRGDFTGANHPSWIKDRTKIKKQDERNNPNDKQWKYAVYKRDNFKCKIADKNCKGRIEAHHILSWRDYPELRFNINNGITLCLAHHPRKRAEEKRLSPYFMELVSVSKI